MPIPLLDEDGFLPLGVHECTLNEIKARFGSFQRSSRRPDLFGRLEQFILEAEASKIVLAMLVDGSFVTSAAEPNDIDLILELNPALDLTADLSPDTHNIISKRRVHRRFGFDLLVGRVGR